MTSPLTVMGVEGLPEMAPGDDLAAAIAAAIGLRDGDVVVVAQKVVSKVEGAVIDPPSVPAGIDPRRAVARTQAAEVVVEAPHAFIVRTRHGFVCANAGIDASNVPGGRLTLLPEDSDVSARALRAALRNEAGVDVAVIVADTFGRAWRVGQVDVAIGVAGMKPLRDERGGVDRQGQELAVTEAAVADALAAAADLVRNKAAGVPVVVVRGFGYEPSDSASAQDLVRGAATDLFPRGRGMLARALSIDRWPEVWEAGVAPADLEAVRLIAPDATVVDVGPPTVLTVTDPVAGGLAAAVLADCGLRVRWQRSGETVTLLAGRAATGR